MAFRFKSPKGGHFYHYCGDCKHFRFVRQVGCEFLGVCEAIKNEPTYTNANDKPCGLWEKRRGKNGA